MPRLPIGAVAMTGAERARRYRERQRDRGNVERAATAAAGALNILWLAVLHSDVDLDVSKPLRDEITALQKAVSEVPNRVRALLEQSRDT
jgi:hypothetical protein